MNVSFYMQDLAWELQTWKSLNLCRSAGFVLGWLLVSLRPGTDLLHKHLRRLGLRQQQQRATTLPKSPRGLNGGEIKRD